LAAITCSILAPDRNRIKQSLSPSVDPTDARNASVLLTA